VSYRGGYGRDEKAIMFSDTDKRHADLVVRLRRDGLSKSQFFRAIITGYISNDPNLISFVTEVKERSARIGKRKIAKTKEDMQEGNQILQDLGLTECDIDFVFDLIERGDEDI
jgi:hypothetical protein